MNKVGKKFWVALVLFGLIGQVAWVVENMYLNVFMYKMFNAGPGDISLMVGASAVAATLTTIIMGALSDRVGKRKIFICGGYIVWGITILAFAFVRMDVLTPLCANTAEAAALGISLVIILDCIMTFFGSTANDAAYNAWLTDVGTDSNRGKIEGINAMMPLVAILVVFGGFMSFNLDKADSWTTIYAIIGGVVLFVGILGFFLIQEAPVKNSLEKNSYFYNLTYSFRLSTLKNNKLLYAIIGAFALFGISIQIFMPYLILYYEQTLQMKNYVLIMAPAIIIASVVTVFYGRLYDMLGFKSSVLPCMGMLIAGYLVLYGSTSVVPVFVGSLLMMCGYLCGMAVFGAVIRERIPESMAGRFQGIRIIGQVLIPGVVGPAIGAFILRDAAQIENSDGTFSFLPDKGIWVGATIAAVVVIVALLAIFNMMKKGHYVLLTAAAERISNNSATSVGTQKSDKTTDSLEFAGCAKAWEKYPRPQMRRENNWKIVNGKWSLNKSPINVPFPPQSILSGYGKKVEDSLSYETILEIPEGFKNGRILLHFGAVDQEAIVSVNDKVVGEHKGGYTSFSFDITEYVVDGDNKLTIIAEDKLSKVYPYGKQSKKRGGMWYTPVSGIWQNVWLENVPNEYIDHVKITPDLTGICIEVLNAEEVVSTEVETINGAEKRIDKYMFTKTVEIALSNGEVLKKELSELNEYIDLSAHVCADGKNYSPRLWSCDEPYLYSMKIYSGEDVVETYFGLRTIEIKEIDGVKRVCLNERPIFMHGVLDQGYYSDGIYLPAEPAEYERDILRMRELGFNMLRKHIKVEPEIFYYYCDKHGMLVMQDMVNSGSYSFIRDTALPTIGFKKRRDDKGKAEKRMDFFEDYVRETVGQVYNHPSIIAYTVFNEGWGQFDSDEMYDFMYEIDGTRLVDTTSGWFWQEKSDFDSEHVYFKTITFEKRERPLLVSECGGYSRLVSGHHFSKYNTYGYGGAKDEQGLTDMIIEMYEKMIIPAIPDGACGCVYTQLSDVEDEVNGLYTYDRKVCKVDKTRFWELGERIKL